MVIRPHGMDEAIAAEAEARGAAAPPHRQARWQAVRDGALLYAAVGLGTVVGGGLRAIASLAIHGHAEPGFPWATLFVNVTGSFAIGLYATLSGPEGRLLAGPGQRQLVMTGICGGYTTFSLFSLETMRLVEGGALPAAGINVGLSVVAWLAAVWAGHAVAARLNRLKGA